MSSLRDFSVDRGVRWCGLKRSAVGIAAVSFLLWLAYYLFDDMGGAIAAGDLHALVGGVCLLILPAIFAWHLFAALRLLLHPRSHPIYAQAARQGLVDEVIANYERQVRESGQKIGPAIFTARFLLNISTMALMDYADILWIYKRQTRHATGMIVYTRDGQQREVCASNKRVDQIMLTVSQICPWVRVGYSDQLWELWSSQRSEFVSRVDLRRERQAD